MQIGQILFLEVQTLLRAHQNNKGENHGDEIAEEALLHGGQIAGQLDEQIHQRKAEGRAQNE